MCLVLWSWGVIVVLQRWGPQEQNNFLWKSVWLAYSFKLYNCMQATVRKVMTVYFKQAGAELCQAQSWISWKYSNSAQLSWGLGWAWQYISVLCFYWHYDFNSPLFLLTWYQQVVSNYNVSLHPVYVGGNAYTGALFCIIAKLWTKRLSIHGKYLLLEFQGPMGFAYKDVRFTHKNLALLTSISSSTSS